jgi:hypothetical protein
LKEKLYLVIWSQRPRQLFLPHFRDSRKSRAIGDYNFPVHVSFGVNISEVVAPEAARSKTKIAPNATITITNIENIAINILKSFHFCNSCFFTICISEFT